MKHIGLYVTNLMCPAIIDKDTGKCKHNIIQYGCFKKSVKFCHIKIRITLEKTNKFNLKKKQNNKTTSNFRFCCIANCKNNKQ